MPYRTNSGGGGGGRSLPKVDAAKSFLYYDFIKTTGADMVPGAHTANIVNLGYGGALTLNAQSSNGNGAPITVVAPASGLGADFGGIGANAGNMATTLDTAPSGALGVTLSCACRFRGGFGSGSPILFTKGYPANGTGWAAPYNAIGFSLSNTGDGQFDCNINIGGANVGQHFTDRFKLPQDTDLWLDFRKTAAGQSTMFIQGTPILSWATPGNIDYGAGRWMVGGNIYTTTDTINGPVYFAELQTAELTDAQIMARARTWLGWN